MQLDQSSEKLTARNHLAGVPARLRLALGGWLIVLFVWAAIIPVGALAQGEERPLAPGNAMSDQKPGSVLVFPLYTSSADAPHVENTRLSVTNTSATENAYIHLFFVDGRSCAPADFFACLAPERSLSFLTSDYDPQTTGYVVAVAINRQGCPISFNHLIGDAYVKMRSGHAANYGAEAFAALFGGVLPGCGPASVTATLRLDGSATGYNAAPRELAVDGLTSPGDGGNSLLFVTRAGGDLTTRGGFVGRLQGVLYDETEAPFSFTAFNGDAGCQFSVTISDFFPRTIPRYSVIVRKGRIGWIKFWSMNGAGLLGVVLHDAANDLPAGRNLHKLSATTDSFVIPLFAPPC
jgi:hypothetical protein